MERHNYTIAEYNGAMELLKIEPNMMEVSRQTGIKWNAIKTWRNKKSVSYEEYDIKRSQYRQPIDISPVEYLTSLNPTLSKENRNAYYSFILGLYLGDGYITNNTTKSLCIYLDRKYDKMNKYVGFCFNELFGCTPKIIDRSLHKNGGDCIIVKYSNFNLSLLFPHIGKGMKHLRKIQLMNWQKDIINHVELVKGLVFSDGCFYYSKTSKTYSYKFTNCSSDIIEIFINSLNTLDIKNTSHIRSNNHTPSMFNGKAIESKAASTDVTVYSLSALTSSHD